MEEMNRWIDEYLELLKNGKYGQLKAELNDLNPADLAEFFEAVPAEKQLLVFRLLSKDAAAETFSYMDPDMQENLVRSITDLELHNILEEMYLDDTVDFLSEMPANLVSKILKNTDEDTRKLINQYLNYPENSAGSLMTNEYVQFLEDMNIGQAMAQLRKTGLDKETIYTCYVINRSRVLVGVLSLREILLADDAQMVRDVMEDDVISVTTHEDQEEVADLFKKYDLVALPVTDGENRLVGIITVDDIVDVIEQENTEDFEKMAALIPAEDEYLKTGVFTLAKNRVVWLLILMVSGTISSFIISANQALVAQVVVLSSFFPMLMDTGGNAGSQASTLTIRGIALGEIKPSNILTVLWKEFRVGVLCGAVLGAVNFVRQTALHSADFKVNVTVSITMGLAVVVAKCLGCLLPLGAKMLKLDPALMASPLLTTVVDAIVLMMFFGLTRLIVL